jgi:hypothetical protein
MTKIQRFKTTAAPTIVSDDALGVLPLDVSPSGLPLTAYPIRAYKVITFSKGG